MIALFLFQLYGFQAEHNEIGSPEYHDDADGNDSQRKNPGEYGEKQKYGNTAAVNSGKRSAGSFPVSFSAGVMEGEQSPLNLSDGLSGHTCQRPPIFC